MHVYGVVCLNNGLIALFVPEICHHLDIEYIEAALDILCGRSLFIPRWDAFVTGHTMRLRIGKWVSCSNWMPGDECC